MRVLSQILIIALAQFLSLNFTVNLGSFCVHPYCLCSVCVNARVCVRVSACELVSVRLKSFKHTLLY